MYKLVANVCYRKTRPDELSELSKNCVCGKKHDYFDKTQEKSDRRITLLFTLRKIKQILKDRNTVLVQTENLSKILKNFNKNAYREIEYYILYSVKN